MQICNIPPATNKKLFTMKFQKDNAKTYQQMKKSSGMKIFVVSKWNEDDF